MKDTLRVMASSVAFAFLLPGLWAADTCVDQGQVCLVTLDPPPATDNDLAIRTYNAYRTTHVFDAGHPFPEILVAVFQGSFPGASGFEMAVYGSTWCEKISFSTVYWNGQPLKDHQGPGP